MIDCLSPYININNKDVPRTTKHMNTSKTGKTGEDLACGYLVDHGYRILKRNHREGHDEIDIIGRSGDGTLVFFEVKTLKGGGGENDLSPEDNMSSAKLNKIERGCRSFAGKNRKLIDERRGWRIDLLAVVLGENNAESIERDSVIRHYENI